MAYENLSLFSYEILGLVGREGAGPHDLLRLARRHRMLARRASARWSALRTVSSDVGGGCASGGAEARPEGEP